MKRQKSFYGGPVRRFGNAFLFLTFFLFFLVPGLKAHAQVIYDEVPPSSLKPVTVDKDSIELEKNYNSILDEKDAVVCTAYDKEDCITTTTVVAYLYITDKLIQPEDQEISKTKNTIFYEGNRAKVFAGTPFYQDEFKLWWQTETRYVDKAIFEEVVADKLTYFKNKITLNPLKVYAVRADIFYASGYGWWQCNQAIWSNCQAGGNAPHYDSGNTIINSRTNTGYLVYRNLTIFDTSDLPDDMLTDSLDFYVYESTVTNGDNDGYDYVVVTASLPSDFTNLSDNDYDDLGDTPISAELDITGQAAGYKDFSLTDLTVTTDGYTGYSLRSGHDLENHTPAGNNVFNFYTYEQADTTNDPYLDITYHLPEPEYEDYVPTTTPSDLEITYNIEELTKKSEYYLTATATTPNETEYTKIRIPVIIWLIIFFVLYLFFDRLITEIFIRLRKDTNL